MISETMQNKFFVQIYMKIYESYVLKQEYN
jgi:hypothetical protein